MCLVNLYYNSPTLPCRLLLLPIIANHFPDCSLISTIPFSPPNLLACPIRARRLSAELGADHAASLVRLGGLGGGC